MTHDHDCLCSSCDEKRCPVCERRYGHDETCPAYYDGNEGSNMTDNDTERARLYIARKLRNLDYSGQGADYCAELAAYLSRAERDALLALLDTESTAPRAS